MSEKTNTVECLIKMRVEIERQHNFFRCCLKENQEQIVNRFQLISLDFQHLLEDIDNTLKAECKHVYEEDYIDICPDRSQKITYCSLCGCSF
jgi:hypothetical protein